MSEEKLNSEDNFYLQYLKTPRYRELHRKTLQRDKYKCQICGTGTNLVVHHVTYRRLGNESLDDLVTLCDSCHFEVHKKDLEKKKQSLFESFIKEENNNGN